MKLTAYLTAAFTLTALSVGAPAFAETRAPLDNAATTATTAVGTAPQAVRTTARKAVHSAAPVTKHTAAAKAQPAKPAEPARAHVGDILKTGNYTQVKNPAAYKLQEKAGWGYYSDHQQRIYRVDAKSGKVLAVLTPVKATPAKAATKALPAKAQPAKVQPATPHPVAKVKAAPATGSGY